MTQYITKKLEERALASNKRQLSITNCPVDFVSNDYLGLARSEALFKKIANYDFDSVVNKNGSTGSRLLAGNSIHAQNLEKKLAKIFKSEDALLFNSGYAANQAIISSVAQKNDTILYDSLSHICLKEGAWLSKADSISFRHNDVQDLETKLKRARGNKFIVIESIYSMDGDTAPIQKVIELAKKFDANIIIDEAHSTGIIGAQGQGLVCDMELEHDFFSRIYTFGKGMGVHGACICGSKKLIDYLINFGRPFIYTTALPVHSIFSIDAAFDYLGDNIHIQKDLSNNIDFFNNVYMDLFENNPSIDKAKSDTPIQPILIPGNEKIKNISTELQKQSYDVRAILSPTVKAGSERLRVSIHAHNSKEEIKNMLICLKDII